MNKRFLVLAGVVTVLSVGTFVVLNKVKPYKQEEPKVADVTSPDQVFGASVASPEAHPEGEAAAPAAAPAGDAAAAVQPTDTAVQPAGSTDAAAAPAPAAETAAAPAADAGGGSVAPLVPTSPAGAAPAASTETASAASAPAAEPAATEPPPPPAAEPAPAPEAAAAAPVEKPKKAAKNPAHAAYKAPKSASAKAKVWWPAENDSKLSLVYAGPASFKKAVVLMFNGAFFKDDSVKSNIKLTDKAGKAVAGAWEIGENNRRMLVFPVPAAGTYKVSIASGLTDNKGRKVGAKLSGPVVIH